MTGTRLYSRLVHLGRAPKFVILAILDATAAAFSVWAALAIRLGTLVPASLASDDWMLLPIMAVAAVPVFGALGLYRIVVRSLGRDAAWRAALASGVLAVLLWSLGSINVGLFVPRSMPIIFALLVFFLVLASRLVVKEVYNWLLRFGVTKKPVLIYGAGAAGTQLAASLSAAPEFDVVGFLDDDSTLWKRLIAGRTVYAPSEVDTLISRFEVEDVLLAVPSATAARRREIIRFLSDRRVHVQTIPSMVELVAGFAGIDRLRDVTVDELLGRDAVDPMAELFESVRDRSVLITGAGGSIGSELCRQVASIGARRLVLFELSEYALYQIEDELRADPANRDIEIVPLLGSVCDEDLVSRILAQHEIEILFHAAAYKHVPLVEANPVEGVRNNTLGTRAVARAAARAGISRAVLISTDKAVRPPNIMGASKRLAERIFIGQQARSSGTVFCTVRFGNVIGSSGSVIPLFQRQIRQGGPITLTDPRITRYFMTIPEAAQLVIQASGLSSGGDLFLLEMGEPVRILDLARRMIHLAGLEVRDEAHPNGDIEIRVTGLRPGEKMVEELLIDAEAVPTKHPKIFRAVDGGSVVDIDTVVEELETAIAKRDQDAVRAILRRTVEGFGSTSPVTPG